QIVLEPVEAGDGGAIGQRQGVVDWLLTAVGVSPATERVEMLEGEAERIDARMAVGAGGLAAVRFQALADGLTVGGRFVGCDRARVGRRRGNGRAKDATEQPVAALDRAGSERRGCHGEDG